MNIYEVEYEPLVRRRIRVSAESEDEALDFAAEIISRTDAIRFEDSNIDGVITQVIGIVGEENSESLDSQAEKAAAFQVGIPNGSSPEAEGED